MVPRLIANSPLSDFSITAKMYGKIIIAEAFLPRKYQSIKPCVVGGLAGGLKYIYNGIFFKVIRLAMCTNVPF